jgi:hypothetical protein
VARRVEDSINMDGQDEEKMMNDECGMMNKRYLVFIHHSSFRIHHLPFILPIHVNSSFRWRQLIGGL